MIWEKGGLERERERESTKKKEKQTNRKTDKQTRREGEKKGADKRVDGLTEWRIGGRNILEKMYFLFFQFHQ